MKKLLNRVLFIVKAKEILKANSNNLITGRYRLLPDFRSFVIISSIAKKEYCNQVFLGNIDWRKKLLCFLFGTVRIKAKTNESSFDGTAMYINNGGEKSVKRIRFFDFRKNIVRSVYLNSELFEIEKKAYKEIGKVFKLPEQVCVDEEKRIIDECLIKSYNAFNILKDESLFCNIIKMYISYGEKCEHTNLKNIKDPFNISQKTKNLSTDFPSVMAHNDLTVHNIVQDENGNLHIIDWEHYSENVFFFDVFYLIINSAQKVRDNFLIDNYFKGTFDSFLSSLFTSFDCNYQPLFKKEYLWYVYMLKIHTEISNGMGKTFLAEQIENFEDILSRY